MDEEKVQTNKPRVLGGNESCSGTHNPKVVGSSPASATRKALDWFSQGLLL